MKNFNITGRLVKNPEMFHSDVVTISIAVRINNETAEFYDMFVVGQAKEFILKYAKKGDFVVANGYFRKNQTRNIVLTATNVEVVYNKNNTEITEKEKEVEKKKVKITYKWTEDYDISRYNNGFGDETYHVIIDGDGYDFTSYLYDNDIMFEHDVNGLYRVIEKYKNSAGKICTEYTGEAYLVINEQII